MHRRVVIAALVLLALILGEGAAAWTIRNDSTTLVVIAPGRGDYLILTPDPFGAERTTVGQDVGDVAHWVPGTAFPFLEREDYQRNLVHVDPGKTLAYSGGELRAPSLDQARVVFVGDTGTTRHTEAVLAQIAAAKPDVVVHVGDISYSTYDESTWDAWYRLLHQHLPSTPIAYATGNHDVSDFVAKSEMDLLRGARSYYSFEAGPVHVIVLDSNRVDDAQATWLADDLAQAKASGAAWIVPVEHHPWYSSGTKHGGSAAPRDAFAKQFAAGGVKIAFAGHEHNYERTGKIDGVTYVVTGGGGASLYDDFAPGQPWAGTHKSAYEFVVVDFARGNASLRAVDESGAIIDSLGLTTLSTGA